MLQPPAGASHEAMRIPESLHGSTWNVISSTLYSTARRRLQSNAEFLPHPADHDALWTRAGRSVEPLDGLEQRLPAQLERLVMHGDEPFRAGVISHLPGLLGRAMRVY